MSVSFGRISLWAWILAVAYPTSLVRADDSIVPASAPVFTYNWGGAYLGLHAGRKSSNLSASFTRTDVNYSDPAQMHADAEIAGGQIGYLNQIGHLVVGFEAAVAAGTAEATETSILIADRTRTMSLGYMFQAAVRLGYAEDRWLAYAKGGVVLSELNIASNEMSTGALLTTSRSLDDGWLMGAGVDYAISSNVILGLEYNYLTFSPSFRSRVETEGVASSRHNRIRADSNILSARISYKFDQ